MKVRGIKSEASGPLSTPYPPTSSDLDQTTSLFRIVKSSDCILNGCVTIVVTMGVSGTAFCHDGKLRCTHTNSHTHKLETIPAMLSHVVINIVKSNENRGRHKQTHK